ncbi:MAG: hypothetical protein ACRDOY_10265 [Nocardioidaceae bacterium]
MLPRGEIAATLAAPLAHPVAGHPHVDVPVALVAGTAALLVFVVTLALPTGREGPAAPLPVVTSWAGRLSRAQVCLRVVAVAVLVLAIATGRLGLDDELENLAPALVVGVAWPSLVLVSITLGAVWRWVDPWDGIARTFSRGEPESPPTHVWPAAVIVASVVWYLSAYPDLLDPRAVGMAVALYTVLTLAGCVAAGRVRWLASAEPLGTVLSWMALVPKRRLADWSPPPGAEAVLGVLTGGLLFGLIRTSELWAAVNQQPAAELWATVGLACCCVLVAVLLVAVRRFAASLGGGSGVVWAVVPATAGIVLAVALERNRLFTSVQLLPGLFGDPFGYGWNLLGPAVAGLDPTPIGAAALLVLQLAVLVVAHLVGAFVVARRLQGVARVPAATVLLHLMGVSAAAIAVH